ncbi:uncharacterized protein BDR25DRAFT_303241 [Lindgomyces ingoldianus]|uniref:Uncharacterized protein n=1 Tax=Lindgomyces ingoldianus TaxID=673940 RepID=A0ACB6QY60_9PLEO|nr:uncharacterized protein BDR25DRAFT_303241 [Lindgomyces ingoldianus]KAF2471856.1 hypothetical protein BDR25DRAFT_303241 [Lindgomyces ingoldianus]
MPASRTITSYVYASCLRASQRRIAFWARTIALRLPPIRYLADSAPQSREKDTEDGKPSQNAATDLPAPEEKEEGAMTRRLRSMSESSLETGSRSSQNAVLEAGFSEDLKKKLEERIVSTNFRSDHRNAFAELEAPSHVGCGTRDIATAEPWSGEESLHDASLRMLNDAHKPLRSGRGAQIPGPAVATPKMVGTGRKSRAAAGMRLADARDRSVLYGSLKESDISDKEKEKRFQELKDRFSPHARAVVPGTIQGLASLANERIEDAIARGQFKNLPRGQTIERDYNASSPFLDTTEYFMNKIIQKQDIVPPWIEKQQELVSTATKFRARLRNDWKRHAARMIASKGGTLQDQMRRAEAYAKAELIVNPQKKKTETVSTVDNSHHLSQISLSGELKAPASDSSPFLDEIAAERVASKALLSNELPASPDSEKVPTSSQSIQVPIQTSPASPVPPAPYPFRDPAWEATESSYHTLSINDLNSKTRSYNLQAPDLAKKPYFSLTRELDACYAEVAPQLAEAIRERATMPKAKVEGFGASLAESAGVMDRLVGEKARVRDERVERRYGFRQFWRDIWGEAKG